MANRKVRYSIRAPGGSFAPATDFEPPITTNSFDFIDPVIATNEAATS